MCERTFDYLFYVLSFGRGSEEVAMSPTHGAPEKSNPVLTGGLAAQSHLIAAADTNDVMRDQLEFLIEHTQNGACGCAFAIATSAPGPFFLSFSDK